MFTLKIAQRYAHDGGATAPGRGDDLTWFPTWLTGVMQVQALPWDGHLESLHEPGGQWYDPGLDTVVEVHAYVGDYQPPDGGPQGHPLTLLMATLPHGIVRLLLVEKAWLLGPDGGTIERIAP